MVNEILYLEIGSLMLFLGMVLHTQLARARVPGYYSSSPRKQFVWLSTVFLLMAVGFGVFLFSTSPLLALALAAGFTLSLVHPVNALSFFIHLLFLRPWEIITTNPLLLALPRLLALMCFVSWLLFPGKGGRPTAKTAPALYLLLGYSLWLFLTTFRVPDMAAAQMEWLDTFLKPVIVFLLCLYFVEDELSVQELKRTLVISTFALVIVGFYRYFFEVPDPSFGGRLHSIGMLGDSNDLAAGVVMVLPLALVPAFGSLANGYERLKGVCLAGLALAAIGYSQSRGAMLAVMAEVLAFTTLYTRHHRFVKLLLMLVILGLGYAASLRVLGRSTEEMGVSQQSRLIYWKAAIAMTAHHPIWGVGFAQYPANYESYATAVRFEWGKRTAHSTWLLAFAESGVVGGGLLIAFFVAVWRTAWAHRATSPDLLYSLTGYGLTMSFLSHTYMLYPYVLSGLILAAGAVEERETNDV